MKFKVEPKDFVIFIIFCFFLLYVVAIGVLNFKTFGATGEFFGLNPFPAFSLKYLSATITIFAIALIAIFASVSSYIFSRDKKGFGLKIEEKQEKGYAHWAKDKEIKNSNKVEKVNCKSPTATAAGIPLINNGTDMWVDNGENHTLVIGATASGKTTALVEPFIHSIAKKGESLIATDPKGELYKHHSKMLEDNGYNVVVLNFRDPQQGSGWNPLSLPQKLYKEGNIDKATELLDDIARNILIDPKNPGEPFWENNASDYFSGIALGLIEDGKDDEVNLNSIGQMSMAGEERWGNSDYLKEYFTLKGTESTPYIFASSVINAPGDTKGGVVSVFRQKIRLFTAQDNLSEMLSHTDFDIEKIGEGKTAIFIIIHDEKTTYHALATIFTKQCYETLIRVAQNQSNGKLPVKTNFILDEFANMPALKDVTSMVTAARSRDIRFTFIIQNFAQLNSVYGEHDAQTIRSNCGNLIYLMTTELAALEEISKLCGEVKSKEKDKTASTPLITISDLQKLKMNEVVIIRQRTSPFRTKLTPSYKIDWGKEYPDNEFRNREKNSVLLFDLKTHVKEEKKKETLKKLESGGAGEEDAVGLGFKGMPPNFNALFGEHEVMPKGINPMAQKNVNIDEMIKKIDARIAEIEKEEKEKKEEKKSVPALQTDIIKEPKKAEPSKTKMETILPDEPKMEEPKLKEKPEKKEQPKTKVVIDKESTIINNNEISDDEFFDDFFGDE